MPPWYEPTETRELQVIEDSAMEEAHDLLAWSRQLPDNPVTYEEWKTWNRRSKH